MANKPIYNAEMERSLLGSILINPDAWVDVQNVVNGEDFFVDAHRWVWEAFGCLDARAMPFDLLTVHTELDAKGQSPGGLPFLTQLVNSVPTSLHAEAYARLVRRDGVRRRLLAAASEVARLAYDEARDLDSALMQAHTSILSVVEQRERAEMPSALGDLAADCYAEMAARAEPPQTIPTGFETLDACLGGLWRTDLVIVAGRPGTGKSTWMGNVASQAAQQQWRVGLYSYEMGEEALTQRFLSQVSGVSLQRLRHSVLTAAELAHLKTAKDLLANWSLRVYGPGTAPTTPSRLRSHLLREHRRRPFDLVLVDYLQLLNADSRPTNRQEAVAEVSRALKHLAGELGVPVVAGAQLSRALEQRLDRRPQLSDLRESGAIENDADVVLFLHPVDDTQTQLIVAKHRNGPTHPGVPMRFNKSANQFKELN